MKGCFLSPAKTWFKHTNTTLAVVITTGQIYFQLLFNLSHRLHQSLYWSRTDFQYMTAAYIALTKLPFCYNNSPDRYSINVSPHWLFTCLCYAKWELHPGNMSDPLFRAVCAAGPFIRTLHSCWTQLHHMPSTNPILSISHPIPGSFSEQKKKENRFKLFSPVLSSAVTDNCTFTSSSFWLWFSVIDEDLLL